MIARNLSRRLKRLEAKISPACTEDIVLQIISVDGHGNRVDSGIKFRVPGIPKPVKKRRW
jgi:hypothetical protein